MSSIRFSKVGHALACQRPLAGEFFTSLPSSSALSAPSAPAPRRLRRSCSWPSLRLSLRSLRLCVEVVCWLGSGLPRLGSVSLGRGRLCELAALAALAAGCLAAQSVVVTVQAVSPKVLVHGTARVGAAITAIDGTPLDPDRKSVV